MRLIGQTGALRRDHYVGDLIARRAVSESSTRNGDGIRLTFSMVVRCPPSPCRFSTTVVARARRGRYLEDDLAGPFHELVHLERRPSVHCRPSLDASAGFHVDDGSRPLPVRLIVTGHVDDAVDAAELSWSASGRHTADGRVVFITVTRDLQLLGNGGGPSAAISVDGDRTAIRGRPATASELVCYVLSAHRPRVAMKMLARLDPSKTPDRTPGVKPAGRVRRL